MPRKIVFSNVTLCGDGSMMVKLNKQIIDPDTGEILAEQPHRTVIDFDGDVDSQFALVSNHLQQMGYPAVPAKVSQLVKAVDAIAKADAEIEATRQAKIELKALAEADLAEPVRVSK